MHRPLVISAAVFVAFCNYGILQSYGALFVDTLEKYGEGRSKTSLVHSVLSGISLGAGVIAGYLIKSTNLTVVSTIGSVLLPLGFVASYFATSIMCLIISIGVVSGLGISFSYVSAVVVMGTVISEKHKTSALSLQNVACGLPGIVVPYLFAWLTKTYTLSGTFLIYGGIALNNLTASILFSGVQCKETVYKESENDNTVIETHTVPDSLDSQSMVGDAGRSTETLVGLSDCGQLMKESVNMNTSNVTLFVLFVTAVSLVLSSIGGIQAIYQDIGTFKSLSTEQTLYCITAFNIASTVSRFFPMIFEKVSDNPFVSAIVASLSGLTGQVIVLMTSQYYIVLIGYVMTGLADGGTSASIAVIIYKILGRDSQAMGLGLTLTLVGVLVTATGPIYGAIFDETESYVLVLYITTSIFAFGSVLFVACFILYRKVRCC